MDYTARLTKLKWCFALLGAVILGVAGYRMLLQDDALSRRVYKDMPMQRVFEDLAAQKIISPGKDGVAIDIDRLRERIKTPGVRQFVVDRQRYLSFEDGRLVIQPEALTVRNRRILQRLFAGRRGRILDREGRPLARSRANEQGGFVREYALGPAGFPLIGVAHPVYGLKGLEALLDGRLQGAADEGVLKKALRFFIGESALCDVVLTIDAPLQQAAFEALGDRTGAVVVVEVASGDILVAASTPSFDPATAAGAMWDKEAGKGRRGAFYHRALSCRYPPGSTFKLITAAAWLASPDMDPQWRVLCNGRHAKLGIGEYKNKRHGWMDLSNALTHSCNVYFAQLGVRLGPRLADMTELFGFNGEWHLNGLADDPALILASRAFRGHKSIARGGMWEEIDFKRNPKLVAQAAIGQNLIEATPLQMAMVGAAIGNHGRLMKPRLVRRFQHVEKDGSSDGSWITDETVDTRMLRQVCSKQTARDLLAMMAKVVEKGTAHRLKKLYRRNGRFQRGYRLPKGATGLLAGKTGTAEAGNGQKDHAWFVGVAPLDDPAFAVAVMVEHGGLGARTAGPVAVKVLHAALTPHRIHKDVP